MIKMKKKLGLLPFVIMPVIANAQNVGIGTATPQTTLDVKGNQRIGGINSYIAFDSLSGKIDWRNANLFVPVSQRLIQHSAAADGLFYNNIGGIGQLEYRNAAGNPVFYTSFMSGNGYFAGNLGIGATTPQAKLHIFSTSNEAARLDASEPYLSLYSNGVYKGYFWKSPNSIEIGSASGSSLPVTLAPDGYQRMFVTPAGNVGIGIGSPLARLHIADSSVLFSANGYIPTTPGNTPINGFGRRMMWYADKAAFRAGFVQGLQWDKDNVGDYSFASGYNTIAKGTGSVAIGSSTTAAFTGSTAIGVGTNANAPGSTALGAGTYTGGAYSTAMGYSTVANGDYSTAMGGFTNAKAPGSLSVGFSNDSTDSPHPFIPASTDRIFQIGNCTFSVRSNALTVLRNGNTGIGTVSPNAPLQFSNSIGNRKIVLWEGTNNDHQFYGFGINGSVLRYQTPSVGDDHIFYSGSGTNSSTELFRIKGNGNTGVGVSDPAYILDVGARMRIRSSGSNSAGIWLNNSANNSLPAFIGMRSDNLVGFYGSAAPNAGWGFLMNTDNGKVGIGTDNPAAQLEVNGYTKLGSDAPSIKMKKLTGTTSPNNGGEVSIAHGLDFAKILSVSVMVSFYLPTTSNLVWVHSGDKLNFANFQWACGTTNISVTNFPNECFSIFSVPIKIVITYEE